MFKTILKDCSEIAEYIEEISSHHVDIEVIEEYFLGCKAILKECLVSEIIIDNENIHKRDEEAEDRYKLLPIETMPPIIIENNIIVDGNHRFRVLKYLGVMKLKAYEVIEIYEAT